jgi:hypothetical protein
MEDVRDQLGGVFGMYHDGNVLPLEKLTHLSPDQAVAARLLRDLLWHYTSNAEGVEGERHKNAYERMVLEISFTALNRLAALRLCEERGLVVECIRKGSASAGFQVFERISGGSFSSRYESYKTFLECMFDELAVELGVLFDRTTPQSMIFPTERCMEDLLSELNKPELADLWAADETIGWIYQYFNPREERKALRGASQAPRNSRELAVRNQFFTPRYVVEFLTDNTLGRIWYEMRKGDTALKEECRYLVKRPKEIFLAPGEKPPAGGDEVTDLPREELLKRPDYIEHRPKKDPRDLKIIDPACGSGHFLLYVFDLLEEIYEEAWNDPDSPKSQVTGRTIQEDFKTLEDLRRETPKLIVEYNLHGIDIDPRAVQIAASALWLRAQKSWKNLGLKLFERPGITKSNIVTAEPMPGEEDMRREFTAGLKPRVLGQIVDEIFEKMKLAGEAGSLLKIEEEIKQAVAEAKKQWMKAPGFEQKELFQRPPQYQAGDENRFDLSGVTDEKFWERAEDRILDALKDYAEQAENGLTFRRRLFAQDAARGFAFIDLCRKRYDVVLMNPPFGHPPTRFNLKALYPGSSGNLIESFVARARDFTRDQGLVGSVIDATVLIKSSYEKFRRSMVVIKNELRACAWLGWGVLDTANVEVGLLILSTGHHNFIFDCLNAKESPEVRLAAYADGWQSMIGAGFLIATSPKMLESIPNYSFPLSPDMVVHIGAKKLRNVLASAKQGVAPVDSFRVIRLRCEVSPHYVGSGLRWWNVNRGGAYCPFYRDYADVICWEENGKELKEDILRRYPYLNGNVAWVAKNEEYYGKPGLGYGKRTDFLSCQILPKETIITVEGFGVFPHNEPWVVLGFLNSRVVAHILNTFCGQHKYSGYMDNIPVPDLTTNEKNRIASLARSGFGIVRSQETKDILSPLFGVPCLLGASISYLIDKWKAECKKTKKIVEEILDEIDQIIAAHWFSIQPTILKRYDAEKGRINAYLFIELFLGFAFGRWDVRIALDPSLAPELPDPFDPLPVCPPGMLVGPDGLPAEPNRIVSEEWLRARPDANTLPPEGSVKNPTIPDSEYPLRIFWDGILVDDPGLNGVQPHREDIVRRVREVLELLWKDKAHEIEQEACEILGVSELRDYFRKPSGFFQDHLKRYSKSRRKAPIYWPLSTASGSYTVWVYYQRLTDQTLYSVVNKFVEPKIDEVERGVGRIENEKQSASGREAVRLNDLLKEYRSLLSELQDFREELLRIAELPYKPDLNDGVIINAGPFHKLFRLRSWAKETEDCWKKLEKGGYDWSHVAYTIWPERVRKVCRKDRSIALAHGLEDVCEAASPSSKKRTKRSRRSGGGKG